MSTVVQNADGSTPIAVTSSALPTGASTSAAQTTGNASLASIDGKIVAVDTGAVVIASGTVAVTGPLTDAQLRAVAVPVSGTVAVTGSATAANQATEIASLASIDGKITAVNTGAVTISAALPAGNNNIGDVDIASGTVTANLGTIAGVATAAKQPALGTAGSASTDVLSVQGIAAMTPLLATLSGTNNIATVTTVTTVSAVTAITNALPAGTNAIGKLAANSGVDIGDVDVTSLPALVAGTANIGDVDVLTVPADPFGVNADAASSSGSISAKLRALVNLSSVAFTVTALQVTASGDTTLVASGTRKIHRVEMSNSHATTALTAGLKVASLNSGAVFGKRYLPAAGGACVTTFDQGYLQVTSEVIAVNLSVAGTVEVTIYYE